MEESDWQEVGQMSVDSGMLMIGDPCYHIHKEKAPGAFEISWPEFCEATWGQPVVQLKHDAGHPGLAVVLRSGGDGTFYLMSRVTKDGYLEYKFVTDARSTK